MCMCTHRLTCATSEKCVCLTCGSIMDGETSTCQNSAFLDFICCSLHSVSISSQVNKKGGVTIVYSTV